MVTRGNVDLKPVLESLSSFYNVIVWDNSKDERDEKVYGRYLAALSEATQTGIVAVQDDDAIIHDWPAILRAYEPGVVTCNMVDGHTHYYKPMRIALVGFGGVFEKSLIKPTFDRYLAHFPADELFQRECDRVFTGLNPLKVVSVPYTNLPHEQTTQRMWREPRHGKDLSEILSRIAKVRQGAQFFGSHRPAGIMEMPR